LIAQQGHIDTGDREELVTRVSDHDELVLPPIMNTHALVGDRTFDERDVDLKANEHAEDHASVRAGHTNTDARVRLMEPAEHGRQQVGRDGGACGDAENAALETTNLAHLVFGRALHAEQLSGASIERLTRIGEAKRATAAIDQGNAERALEIGERFGDGGLAESQRRGCFGEAAVVDHRREQPEMMQVQRYSLQLCIDENNILAS